MGCAISGLVPKQVGDVIDDVPIVQLTDEHREIIKETWKVIQENIAKVGIIMFVGLFETHPECKDVFFLFRDVEDLERLRNNKELQTHGLRIMHFIEKSVARLNQMERLDQLILDLGKSHYRYNSPPKYYMYVGAEFIRAVQPILKDNWTSEVEEAWKTLFLYITSIMKQGYVEEEKNQRNTMANTRRERPEKRLNVI
ncbi:neuroglobin-like [Oncorhynchus masou masou]|uniref:neuroglobin-like n=1 Tax=Oncorhynchus masou masou TaxID=90313 RepID=UPI0031843307